jgi:palmitoyltransferase
MGTMASDKPAQQDEQDDIMQIARLGDIQGMERLFETAGYDATYTDEEGITPLHVGPLSSELDLES